MFAFPPSSTALSPCTLPAPGALLSPPPLLLPRSGLLLRTLRLLLLPGLLRTLFLPLLGPLLLGLLDPLLPRLLLRLRLLSLPLRGLLGALSLTLLDSPLLRLLSGLSTPLFRLVLPFLSACPRLFLLPTLLLFSLAPFFILPVLLRVRREHHPEKQEQGSGAGSSNELHDNRLRWVRYSVCTRTAKPV